MTQIVTQNQTQTPSVIYDTVAVPIVIKLDGTNYALWSQIVEMYILGKDKLGYINGDLTQPEPNDPHFRRWRTENSIVKGWLINSMESSLIGNFIRFSTAKQVWDSIATTYFDGSDTSQVYDLKRRVTRMKQSGESIETYYNCLQGLWREIDFRRPNPMECAVDIQKYNALLQEDRVYTFLEGLDDRLDNIRSDVLQLKPFPTVEQAYAYVRKEAIRQTVMLTNNGNSTAAAMVSRGGKAYLPRQQALQITRSGTCSSGGRNIYHLAKTKRQVESESSGCSHCGNMKHTRDTCFKLHGYPEWWNELKTRKQRVVAGDTGQAYLADNKPQLSLAPLVESGDDAIILPKDQGNTGTKTDWIVDSGATDHMTFLFRRLCEYYRTKVNWYNQC